MKVNGLVPLDFQELSERLIVAPIRGDRGHVEDPHTFQGERYPVRRGWSFVVLDFFIRRHLSGQPLAYRPVVVVSIVPIAVSRESQDRSSTDMVREAKADLQIAGSFCLTQLVPVQRNPTFETCH